MRNKNVGVGVANTNSIVKDATKSIILVIMMNEEKRFVCIDIGYGDEWYITDNGERLSEMEIVDLLNKQQDTIITLKKRLEKINGGYGLLVHRNGLTANEWVIESQERELKKKNELISDLKEENEQLKEQVQILNKCCRLKLSDEAIKQAYADLNRREIEKHSQGNATYTAKIN